MKAAVCRQYGSPDVVRIEEVENPVPRDNEVLIKVHAASLNPADWHLKRGKPYLLRLLTGLRKPRDPRLGIDVAGEVEAVGRKVTQFKPGDAVFGMCRGALAEYACVSESKLVMKPDNVTFEQAAAAPVAGLTALQGLRDKGKVQPGQKVLINGAAGGVGTFTVQIAKWLGAEVTGICSTRNLDLVRSIGADAVIDYTQEDFTRSGKVYDLIFDLVGNHSVSACKRVLNPKGVYIAAGVLGGWGVADLLARALTRLVLSLVGSQKFVTFIARSNKDDLTFLGELMASGKVKPVIDRRYSLNEVPEAIRYLEQQHARGKVVTSLD